MTALTETQAQRIGANQWPFAVNEFPTGHSTEAKAPQSYESVPKTTGDITGRYVADDGTIDWLRLKQHQLVSVRVANVCLNNNIKTVSCLVELLQTRQILKLKNCGYKVANDLSKITGVELGKLPITERDKWAHAVKIKAAKTILEKNGYKVIPPQ